MCTDPKMNGEEAILPPISVLMKSELMFLKVRLLGRLNLIPEDFLLQM